MSGISKRVETAIGDAKQVVSLVGDPGWGSVELFLATANGSELEGMRELLARGYNVVCAEEQRRRREGRR